VKISLNAWTPSGEKARVTPKESAIYEGSGEIEELMAGASFLAMNVQSPHRFPFRFSKQRDQRNLHFAFSVTF
jgi:hypothetical protein